jgi:hypothetical protein
MSVFNSDTFDIINNIKENNIYVNNDKYLIREKLESKSIEDLGKISWSSLLDFKENDDSNISLSKSSSISNSDNIDSIKKKNKIKNIDEILEINFNELNDIELLEYKTYVSGFLRKNIKNHIELLLRSNVCFEIENLSENNTFEWDKNIKYLNWLADTCLYFSKKLRLPIVKNCINKKKSVIPRSSYKFCDYNYECEYNYDPKNHGCYAQHYVYNNVYSDLKSLLTYFNSDKINNYKNINMKEVKKCIDTISYVISHMREELKNVVYYNDIKDINKLHRERIPSKNKNKNNKNNRNKKNYKKKKKFY